MSHKRSRQEITESKPSIKSEIQHQPKQTSIFIPFSDRPSNIYEYESLRTFKQKLEIHMTK